MKTIAEIRKEIERVEYCGAKVRAFKVESFGDEVKIVFDCMNQPAKMNNNMFLFSFCNEVRTICRTDYMHGISQEKKTEQIPCFLDNIEVCEITRCNESFMQFEIEMYPFHLHIVCKEFNVSEEKIC